MTSSLALILLTFTSGTLWAQTETNSEEKAVVVAVPQTVEKPDSNYVYTVVEQQPEYPGGINKMMEDLRRNIVYPEKAVRDSVQGTVYVQFVVRKNGSLSDVVAIKGVAEELDRAAVTAVKSFQPWIPGKQRGEPVNVRFVLPVKFSLKAPVQKGMLPVKDSTEVFTVVEYSPEYPGGYEAMMKYIKNKLKVFKETRSRHIGGGTVYVQFIVDKDGSLKDIGIYRGVSRELDDQAMHIVKGMPNWKPGQQNFKPVRVKFVLPIRFDW